MAGRGLPVVEPVTLPVPAVLFAYFAYVRVAVRALDVRTGTGNNLTG